MNIKITSVSKKAENLSQTAAAVHVITSEDIRRSGVTSLPEALRLVPGLQVARIDANKWAVSARGFNDRFANKLLVLIDGRTVYTPLFSGVFWNLHDIVLEDIERIEVIRGPGATLWGANAVNGVINIITKKAQDTQGGLVSTTLGTEIQPKTTFRYGSKIGEDLYYRYYIQHTNHDDFVDRLNNDAADEWNLTRGGFRIDWDVEPSDAFTFLGEAYSGTDGTTSRLPVLTEPYWANLNTQDDVWGMYLLSKWDHEFSDRSDMHVQMYYDKTRIDSLFIGDNRDTFDIEFQNRYDFENNHELIWGIGYRFSGDDIRDTLNVRFRPQQRDLHLFSAFVQDEISFFEDELQWTIGSKIEHNDFTGFEFQPNTRLVWTPTEKHSYWAAISRAVRTPSRIDQDGLLDLEVIPPGQFLNLLPVPALARAMGDSAFESEELIAYEIGYRSLLTERVSVDLTAFYNDYDNLRSADFGVVSIEEDNGIPYVLAPLLARNHLEGETYGVELSSRVQINSWWDVQIAYTALNIILRVDPGHFDGSLLSEERGSPHHQISMLHSIDIYDNIELDLWFRYTEELPGFEVEDIFSLDAKLGWKPSDTILMTIGARNLLDSRKQEFTRTNFVNTVPTEVERSFYANVTWTF